MLKIIQNRTQYSPKQTVIIIMITISPLSTNKSNFLPNISPSDRYWTPQKP